MCIRVRRIVQAVGAGSRRQTSLINKANGLALGAQVMGSRKMGHSTRHHGICTTRWARAGSIVLAGAVLAVFKLPVGGLVVVLVIGG